MKRTFIALILLLILSCTNNSTKDKWMYYYDQYISTADKTALDSALFYIEEEMKGNPKNKWSLYGYQLMIYSIKEEYDKALSSCFNDTIVIDGRFPFYQKIIKERFQAMKAQSLHDFEGRNRYLMETMKTIGNYMKQNGLEMANALDKQKTTDLIDGHIALLNNFFQCKAIVDGKDAAFHSLDSLYAIHNNMGCYDTLYDMIENYTEDDFMQFGIFG